MLQSLDHLLPCLLSDSEDKLSKAETSCHGLSTSDDLDFPRAQNGEIPLVVFILAASSLHGELTKDMDKRLELTHKVCRVERRMQCHNDATMQLIVSIDTNDFDAPGGNCIPEDVAQRVLEFAGNAKPAVLILASIPSDAIGLPRKKANGNRIGWHTVGLKRSFGIV